jgi:hypothetical protein
MGLKAILSQEEIDEYHQDWDSFTGKYKSETSYNVHSGLPVIGKVFQFKDKPIFRAHIFKRKLKKAFDPYFISSEGYLHPNFHIVHYCFPIEQIVHASLGKIVPNYSHYLTIDRFDSKKPAIMKGKVDFNRNNPASIEVIPKVTMWQGRFVLRGEATFYEDKTNTLLQKWYFEGFGDLRKYVKNIKRLQQGDEKAIEDLVREIKEVGLKQERLLNPRQFPPKDQLIQRLRNREIPEEELHDFFSYWDKE